MGPSIVAIAESHADGFHACVDAVARERRYLAQWEAPPLEQMRGFVRGNVASDAPQFVALEGPLVIGWCDILPAWGQAVRHRGRVGMGLLPAYRGQGLGRALLSTCLAKAGIQGITRVELEVRADNERAIRLYEKCGFATDVVKRQGMCFDGVYYSVLEMSLILADGVDLTGAVHGGAVCR